MSLAYSLSISPPNWVDLPTPRFGSDYQTIQEENVEHETDGLQEFIYRLGKRRIWTLEFRVKELKLLDAFGTLDAAVDGRLTPFYIQFEDVVMYGRKNAGFSPKMITIPVEGRVYDYTLIVKEVIPA